VTVKTLIFWLIHSCIHSFSSVCSKKEQETPLFIAIVLTRTAHARMTRQYSIALLSAAGEHVIDPLTSTLYFDLQTLALQYWYRPTKQASQS